MYVARRRRRRRERPALRWEHSGCRRPRRRGPTAPSLSFASASSPAYPGSTEPFPFAPDTEHPMAATVWRRPTASGGPVADAGLTPPAALAALPGPGGIRGPSAAIRSPGRARGARVGEASEPGRRSTALGGDSIAGSCAWSTSGRGFGAGAAFNGPRRRFDRRVVRVEHEWARLRGRGGVHRALGRDFDRRVVRVEHEWARLRSRGGVQRPSAAIGSPGRARGARVGEASEAGRRSTAVGGDSIAGSCAWSTSGRGFGAGAGV